MDASKIQEISVQLCDKYLFCIPDSNIFHVNKKVRKDNGRGGVVSVVESKI